MRVLTAIVNSCSRKEHEKEDYNVIRRFWSCIIQLLVFFEMLHLNLPLQNFAGRAFREFCGESIFFRHLKIRKMGLEKGL